MDLGECTKIHDLALRADYEIASKERELFFELDVEGGSVPSGHEGIMCAWFPKTSDGSLGVLHRGV